MTSRKAKVQRNSNAPLRILSLDGGGVRGLSSLMVLDQLMKNIAMEERRLGRGSDKELKPCDYFDLIGGTSTGGIIAILLGRLRLTCRQCIAIYQDLSKEIFKRDRSIKIGSIKIPTGSYRFSGDVLERKIKGALVDLGFSEDEKMWDSSLFYEDDEPQTMSIWDDQSGELVATAKMSRESLDETTTVTNVRDGNIAVEHDRSSSPTSSDNRHVHRRRGTPGCHALVVTALEKALGLPRILATYNPHDQDTKIWEALRATTAAPTFFEPITFGNPQISYLDGGMGWNNPCREVVFAAKKLWEHRSIGIIVSIGTGLQRVPEVRKVAPWLPFGLGTDIALASALAAMATATSRVHNEMQRDYLNTATKYFRFDVEGGLAAVSLEQWMREVEISSKTQEYMDHEVPSLHARQASELLVQYTHLPKEIAIPAEAFLVGIRGRGLVEGAFVRESIDFKDQTIIKPPNVRQHTKHSSKLVDVPEYDSDAKTIVSLHDESDRHEGEQSLIRHPTCSKSDSISPTSSSSSSDAPSTTSLANFGMSLNQNGLSYVYPVLDDLDGDGRREEATVLTCISESKVCLRLLRTNLPPGSYRVTFLVRFTQHPKVTTTTTVMTATETRTTTTTTTTLPGNPIAHALGIAGVGVGVGAGGAGFPGAALAGAGLTGVAGGLLPPVPLDGVVVPASTAPRIVPPTELIFSAGRPYNPKTFLTSVPDVRISADIGPVLLHPDASRARVGRKRYLSLVGREWQEVRPETEVMIGPDGCMGIVISCPFKPGVAVSGWSFGGVRIEPVIHDHDRFWTKSPRMVMPDLGGRGVEPVTGVMGGISTGLGGGGADGVGSNRGLSGRKPIWSQSAGTRSNRKAKQSVVVPSEAEVPLLRGRRGEGKFSIRLPVVTAPTRPLIPESPSTVDDDELFRDTL